jgi:dTDP-4-amino-4,6-dideoxygalactose transaminase
MGVPLFASSLAPYHDRLSEALDRVARSGRYILGPEVEAFEREFAAYLGVRHCVGVANGTDALTIALRALGVQSTARASFYLYTTEEEINRFIEALVRTRDFFAEFA